MAVEVIKAEKKVNIKIYAQDEKNPNPTIPFGVRLQDLKVLLLNTLRELEAVQQQEGITYYLQMDIEDV